MINKPIDQEYFDDSDLWPQQRLEAYQLRKLRATVDYAYHNLPFYRRRFDQAGVRPEHIKTFQDFSRIPILTKADVMAEMQARGSYEVDMEAPDTSAQPTAICMTSGTVGTGFLRLGRGWARPQKGAWGDSMLRVFWWAKLRPGMRLMISPTGWHALSLLYKPLVQGMGIQAIVPGGTFMPRFSASFLSTIMDLKPDYVDIFLPMLYAVVGECYRRRIDPKQAFASVKYIVAEGAALTPQARRKLVQDLGVEDVYELAGLAENVWGGMECSHHNGHHLMVRHSYLEVVHPKTLEPVPPGQRGLLIGTYMDHQGSIYIRYMSQDIGELLPGPCACGRTWPRFEVYDRLPNQFAVAGKQLLPYDIRLCLDDIPPLCGLPFAVIRKEGDSPYLRLAITKLPFGDPAPLEARAKALVQQKLGLEARIEWVEDLPARWKGRPVIEEREWMTGSAPSQPGPAPRH